MIEAAILAVERDAAQIEHRQNVGVANLVLQAEAHQVEVAQRRERFQAVQRQTMPAQNLLEIRPGGEDALAGPLGVVVHDRVKDL